MIVAIFEELGSLDIIGKRIGGGPVKGRIIFSSSVISEVSRLEVSVEASVIKVSVVISNGEMKKYLHAF